MKRKRALAFLISLALLVTMLPVSALAGDAAADGMTMDAEVGDPCAAGHDYEEEVTQEPTCAEPGIRTYTCSVCGDSYDEEISTIDHSMEESEVIEPTCEEDGKVILVCSECGETAEEKGEKKLGHDYEVEITPPTCGEDGVKTYTCSRCGDSYTEKGEKATGKHNYDKGEVTESATEKEEGVMTYTCATCGATKTESIPKLKKAKEEEKEEKKEEEKKPATYKVSLPSGEKGYEVEAEDDTKVEEGDSFSFSVTIDDGYKAGKDFAVKAGDKTLKPDSSGTYTVNDIKKDVKISVKGVEKDEEEKKEEPEKKEEKEEKEESGAASRTGEPAQEIPGETGDDDALSEDPANSAEEDSSLLSTEETAQTAMEGETGELAEPALNAGEETTSPYELYVKGIAVTDENSKDILGDGTVSFADSTLHLKDADLTEAGTYGAVILFNADEQDLTIEIEGDCRLAASSAKGISAPHSSITIEGGKDASLTINLSVDGDGSEKEGIYADEISITGGITVTVDGENSYGLCADGALEVKDSTVEVKAASYNAISSEGTVSFEGSKITAKAENSAIHSIEELVINGGTVTATAAKGIAINSNEGAIEIGQGTNEVHAVSGPDYPGIFSTYGEIEIHEDLWIVEPDGGRISESGNYIVKENLESDEVDDEVYAQDVTIAPAFRFTYEPGYDSYSGIKAVRAIWKGSKLTLPACMYSGKSPCGTFTGWLIDDGFQRKVYQPGETYDPFDSQTVTAQWNHDWDVPTYTWAEDNTSVTAKRVCKNDSAHTETETVKASETDRKESSCTEKGSVTYTSNAFKNTAFEKQTKTVDVDALGHDWGEWTTTKEATETESGAEERTCKREGCGEKETREIPPLNHTHSMSKTEKKDATCTEDGNIEYYHCTKCDKYFKDIEGKEEVEEADLVIKATGHSWGDASYAWAENNGTVTASRICKNNAEHVETEAVATKKTTTATCEKDGTATYTAAFENTGFTEQKKEVAEKALGHVWTNPAFTWTDNNSKCTVKYTCARDASHTTTVSATVKGMITMPTTSADGKISYTATSTLGGKTVTDTRETAIKPAGTSGYKYTSGANSTFTKGSSGSLNFTIKRDEYDVITFRAFKGVTVNGKAVDSKYLTTAKGSLKLALSKDYLQTLTAAAGTAGTKYTLNVQFNDGSASTTFTVIASGTTSSTTTRRTTTSSSPRTGDYTNALLWIGIVAASAAAVGAILYIKKKGKKS